MEKLHCHGLTRPTELVQVMGDRIDVISDIKEKTIKDKRTKEEKRVFSYVRTRYTAAEYVTVSQEDRQRLSQLEEAFGELADMVLSGGVA